MCALPNLTPSVAQTFSALLSNISKINMLTMCKCSTYNFLLNQSKEEKGGRYILFHLVL